MACMKTVFMYAGQGSQHSGMGKDMYEKYPAYRRVLDGLELDFDIKKLMHEGDTSVLAQTEYTAALHGGVCGGCDGGIERAGDFSRCRMRTESGRIWRAFCGGRVFGRGLYRDHCLSRKGDGGCGKRKNMQYECCFGKHGGRDRGGLQAGE